MQASGIAAQDVSADDIDDDENVEQPVPGFKLHTDYASLTFFTFFIDR